MHLMLDVKSTRSKRGELNVRPGDDGQDGTHKRGLEPVRLDWSRCMSALSSALQEKLIPRWHPAPKSKKLKKGLV